MNYINTNLDTFSNMILTDVGHAIVEDKQDVIDILENAGVEVDPSSSNIELVDTYINALPNNEQLLLGTAYYIQLKNSSGFDGVDNDSIYSMYDKLYDTWCFDDEDDDYEESSNAVGVISGLAKAGVNIGKRALEQQDERRNGASRAAQRQAEARAKMIQAIASAKETQRKLLEEEEAKRKKKRTTLIVVSSIALVGVVVGILVFSKRLKAK
jgi:hypothetical protein